jgi:hypothetical protein
MADVIVEKDKTTRRRDSTDDTVLESDLAHFHPLVSWRSVIAGLLVAFLTMVILLSLGMAVGGIGLEGGTSAQSAGIFTGVWFLVSSLISLFAGSYFAARISKFHTNRIGSAQGLVIASLFFGLFLWQTLGAIGWVGGMAGGAISGTANVAGAGVQQAAQSPAVQNAIDNAIGDLNLRSDPQTVATGVLTRLLQGDATGARDYLARQANIPPAEAERRIGEMRGQTEQAMAQARDATATALKATGWSLFATLLLGAAAAIGGGALGSAANFRKPLTREQRHAVEDFREVHA